LLKKAIGFPSYIKIVPIPSPESSHSMTKSLEQAGSVRLGGLVTAVLSYKKASLALSQKRNFLEQFVKGNN
jgi:hypothetical protein